MEGYFISKLNRKDVKKILHFIRLRYDEMLSRGLNMTVFWFDGVIDRDSQLKAKGRAFSVEDVLNRGIQACATHVDFEDYLDKRFETVQKSQQKSQTDHDRTMRRSRGCKGVKNR